MGDRPTVLNHLGGSGVAQLQGWWARCISRDDLGWTIELVHHPCHPAGRAVVRAVVNLDSDDGFAVYVKVAALVRRILGVSVADAYIDAIATTLARIDLDGVELLDGPVSVPHHPHHPAA